uniref:Uncharacterized protein n=1 Tax=Romanomermis culicivorax TaxID=13658 RepID=A0A915KZ54_ROMCU
MPDLTSGHSSGDKTWSDQQQHSFSQASVVCPCGRYFAPFSPYAIRLTDALGYFFGAKYLADQGDCNFLYGDRLLDYGVGHDNDCME